MVPRACARILRARARSLIEAGARKLGAGVLCEFCERALAASLKPAVARVAAAVHVILRARARSLIEAAWNVAESLAVAEFCERALAASLKRGLLTLAFVHGFQFCERALAASLKP